MASFGQAIVQLSKLGMPAMPLAGLGGDNTLTEFEDFGTNPGGLAAFADVPADLPANSPLVVVLHGCTQSAAAYDNGSG